MNIEDILIEIDAEISRLQQAKALLANTSLTSTDVAKRKPGRPPSGSIAATAAAKPGGKRRTMSAEGRARIAAAQKSRWAKSKKASKKSLSTATKKKRGRPAKAVAKKTAAKKTTGTKAESITAQN